MAYRMAKDLLSQAEKDRIVCTFLNISGTPNVDWHAAASDFGSASVSSYRVSYGNTMRKLRDAGANKRKAEDEEPEGDSETPVTPKKPTPKKAKPKRTPKKAKPNDGEVTEDEAKVEVEDKVEAEDTA